MPTRNALASIRLSYSRKIIGTPYHVSIQVWSHSYDHPDPNHRSALVNGVYLTQLPAPPGPQGGGVHITDKYGVDETLLWRSMSSGTEMGFEGFTELDTGTPCAASYPSVLFTSYTGVYDDRCQADPACDARRLQTYMSNPTGVQLSAFNYLAGPVTFTFNADLSAPPTAVRLRMGHIGGNGGNPAQRWALLPDETFIIAFP